MVIQITLSWQLLAAVGFALIMFGIAFNILVGNLGDHKEGYVSFLVALGTAITLAGVAILSWQSALLAIGAFILSGTPMILGDIYQTIKAREAAIKRAQEKVP